MKTILAIFLISQIALGDVQSDRRKYGQARLEQLQQQQADKPVFQEIGTFSNGSEKVLLSVKVKKACKTNSCKPMIHRERERGQLVQYEVHNCRCGDKKFAASKKAQEERRQDRITHARKKRLELRQEKARREKVRVEELWRVALDNEKERIRQHNMRLLGRSAGRSAYGIGYNRYYRNRYWGR